MEHKFFAMLFILFIILLVITPEYNYAVLNEGVYFNHPESLAQLTEFAVKEHIIFYKESLYGSVVVAEQKNFVFGIEKPTYFDSLKVLKINGKIQCGTGKFDTTTTTLLSALPIMLHKDPRHALNIGSGCGLTLGVLANSQLESIDSIDIDPVVHEASRIFDDVTSRPLDDPRVNSMAYDARNFLLTKNKKYDIVVSEPSHPWSGPSNSLFTKEFFEILKNHLNEDGIVVYWFPAVTSSTDSFKTFYKTFHDSFPYIEIYVSRVPDVKYRFFGDGTFEMYDEGFRDGEIIILGSESPISIDNKLVEERSLFLKGSLDVISFRNLSDYHLASGHQIDGFADEAEINTDDMPVLEFLSAKGLYQDNRGSVLNDLRNFLKGEAK